jgi:hypothetical protein
MKRAVLGILSVTFLLVWQASTSAVVIGNIRDHLGAGVTSGSNIQAGTDLLRHRIDQVTYPQAKCNDESAGTFYFRPFSGEANRNRWVIQLLGGGSCTDPKRCQQRWRGVDPLLPVFDADNMSTANLPLAAADVSGILDRDEFRPLNPLANWNHVLVHYCSSGHWSGTSGGTVQAYIPGVWVPYPNREIRLPFLGRRIFEATVDTLRGCDDGVPLAFVDPADPISLPTLMPDLDDAQAVVLAGASGGGHGVTNNLDHLNSLLHTRARTCESRNVASDLRIGGLIDSSFMPALEHLDLESSAFCLEIVPRPVPCTFAEVMNHDVQSGGRRMWGSRADLSCLAWHPLSTVSQCADEMHILTHHVTRPFFVSMGLRDSLISRVYILPPPDGAGVCVPVSGGATHQMTDQEFAHLVRRQANRLARIQDLAEEGASMLSVPGAFVPNCTNHDILREKAVYLNRVGGVTLFDAVRAWFRQDVERAIVVSQFGRTDTCY